MKTTDLIVYINENIIKQEKFLKPLYQTINETVGSVNISDEQLHNRSGFQLPEGSNAKMVELIYWPTNPYQEINGFDKSTQLRFYVKSNKVDDFYAEIKTYTLSVFFVLDEFTPHIAERNIKNGGSSMIALIEYGNNVDKNTLEVHMDWNDLSITFIGKRENLVWIGKKVRVFEDYYSRIYLDKEKFISDIFEEQQKKEKQNSNKSNQDNSNNYQKTNAEYNYDENFYLYLQLKENATQKEINEAYRNIIRKYHSDLNRDDPNADFYSKKIIAAYETLSKEEERKKYDEYLKKVRGPSRGR